MKIKIFSESVVELQALEDKINQFIEGVSVVKISQVVANRGNYMVIVVTILYEP